MSLQVNDVLFASFSGRVGAGAITLTGARIGDKVNLTWDSAYSQSILPGVLFEKAISVNGQIQQVSTSDLSADSYVAYLFRSIAT